jgi:phosphate transport system protein
MPTARTGLSDEIFSIATDLRQYRKIGDPLMPRIHFQQQLAELKNKLLGMAALAQQGVESSLDTYLLRNAKLCQYVRDNEKVINSSHRELDEMAYDLLAKEQPMAIDLRFILAVIKINGDLERIGDQAMSIAIRSCEMLESSQVDLPVDFSLMGGFARRMIRMAIQSLLEGDAKIADWVLSMDDEIDEMNRQAHARLIGVIQEKPAHVLQALNAILIARNLERIADHATNIATDVIFWIRGDDVRHQLDLAAS